MKRKSLLIFFILLFTTISYSFDITVINKDGDKLKNVMVNINNFVYLTDENGKVTSDTKDDILNITLSKEGYYEEKLTLKNNNFEKNLTLIMKPLVISTINFKFSEPQGGIEYREVGSKFYKKIPFLGRDKLLTLPVGTYEFIFYSQNAKKQSKIINISKREEVFYIDFDTDKNTFFFIGNINKNKGIRFYGNDIGHIKPLKDIVLVIFKDGKIIEKIKLGDSFSSVELEDGVYDFKVENKFYNDLFFRGIKLNSESNKNIVISIPPIEVTVNGVIKNKDQFIGGTKIKFIDVNNNVYETISNFAGEFSTKLPPQKYKIVLSKPGFVIREDQNLIYDFTTPKKTYNLTLNTTELFSNVQGIVVDKNNDPISNAKITVKSGENIVNLKSDDFGNFSTSILPGLLFIKVEKDGYKSFGMVKKLERFSSLSGQKIILEPYLSNISGTISNSFYPLSNIHLVLRNTKGEMVANAISNENGYYEFPDLNINQKYYIDVGARGYRYYSSNPIILTRDYLQDQNIFLQSKDIRLFLEFIDSSDIALSNIKVKINNKNYNTDTNGFVLLTLPPGTNSINIDLPSYNYKKNIHLKSTTKNPDKIRIVIKK